MAKGWFGNSKAHSLASRGVKTKTLNSMGIRKYGWKVIWKQEAKSGELETFEEVFVSKSKAKTHIQKLLISAESIDKPIDILNLEEVKK